jgi:glycosyltransferase involved in cell wall biosynthesis
MTASVSIIIPSYNYQDYIAAAVDSALEQTLPCEVIVVDDGSTDNSLAVLNTYGDRIRLLVKANAGESSAVWTGFQHARGSVIIVLDSDDVLHPQCAETVVRHFTHGVVKVQYQLNKIGANDEDKRVVFPHYPTGFGPHDIFEMNRTTGSYPSPPNSGNALSRDLLERILPIEDPRFRNCFDGYVNVLAPLYGSIISLSRVLGSYRVHGANFWARDDKSSMWATYLRHDFDRQDVLEIHAKRLGIEVPPFPLRRNLRHVENRILTFRFAPHVEERAQADDKPGLLRLSLSAAIRSPNVRIIERFAWAAYLMLIVVCPISLLRGFLSETRGDGSQRALVRWFILTSKGLRHSPSSR